MQPRQRIVLLGTHPQSGIAIEQRSILNEEALLEELRVRFPRVDIDVVEMRDLKPQQQLVELSRTSVMITAQGSKSFRMVLLPDGAQVRCNAGMRIARARHALSDAWCESSCFRHVAAGAGALGRHAWECVLHLTNQASTRS